MGKIVAALGSTSIRWEQALEGSGWEGEEKVRWRSYSRGVGGAIKYKHNNKMYLQCDS